MINVYNRAPIKGRFSPLIGVLFSDKNELELTEIVYAEC